MIGQEPEDRDKNDQIRPLDPPDGGRAPPHRTVRGRPGEGSERAQGRFLRNPSYGYDIRCSNEFKIFTNINSTIVDPKAFDAKNFVDFRGEVCIIPPNSFALARKYQGQQGVTLPRI
jgi:hypothetical protein